MMSKKSETTERAKRNYAAYLPVLAGWLVPGGGHFWQRKWGRGALLLVSVVTLFLLGLATHGKIYPYNSGALLLLSVATIFLLGRGRIHRYNRRAGQLVDVAAMFVLWLAMPGNFYRYNFGDFVDTLGWLADLGSGGLYLAAKVFSYDVPEPPSAAADYGTKFLLTAGLLNALAMLDAYDIAMRRKD